MDRRTRYRAMTYSQNQHGETVELRCRQAPTPDGAVALAAAAARGRIGAIAYEVLVSPDGCECSEPRVLARYGNAPEHP